MPRRVQRSGDGASGKSPESEVDRAVTLALRLRELSEAVARLNNADTSYLVPPAALSNQKAAEARARRDTAELRDLAAEHVAELERLRAESKTASRRSIRLSVLISAVSLVVGAITGWSLSALNAAQFLADLFHH